MKNFNFIDWLPVFVLGISIAWVGFSIVNKNITSKEVVFSFTALCAAALMFVLNVHYTLKKEVIKKEIPCHIEHYKDKMMPRSIHNTHPNFIKFNNIDRLIPVPDSSQAEINHTSEMKFEYISEYLKIVIVGTLLDEFPDWDPKTKNFLLSTVVSYRSNKAQAENNSFYSSSELVKLFKLQVPDDFYSDLCITCQGLTLPPNTNLESTGQNLIIDNPYLSLEISFDFSNHIQSGRLDYDENSLPISNGWNGEPVDFRNYFLNILYKVQYKKFRYGDINRDSYVRWISALEAFLSQKFSP